MLTTRLGVWAPGVSPDKEERERYHLQTWEHVGDADVKIGPRQGRCWVENTGSRFKDPEDNLWNEEVSSSFGLACLRVNHLGMQNSNSTHVLNECQEDDKLEGDELHHGVMNSELRLEVLEDLEHGQDSNGERDGDEQVQPEPGEVNALAEHAVHTSRLGDIREDGDEESDDRVLEHQNPLHL